MPPPIAGPNRIETLSGVRADPQAMGDKTIARQLGSDSRVTLKELGVKADVINFPSTPRPGLPPPSVNVLPTPLQTSPLVVIRDAVGFATGDHGDLTPPPMPAPEPGALGVPQGAGVAEYNVTSPYGSGPGVSEAAVNEARPDASGQRVVSVGAKSKPETKSLWPILALVVVIALLAD
jgi:hypothetical protein